MLNNSTGKIFSFVDNEPEIHRIYVTFGKVTKFLLSREIQTQEHPELKIHAVTYLF